MATLLHSESRRLYSWWWDSHISPKNSKWLQENLTDMDSKVKQMIKLIEEDADSFARRAEMYYKKRPELMKLVEEFYRAYRALAERYDHATGELRHAQRTMAAAFPNQIPLVMAEDSPSGSSVHDTDPRTPEMPHPIRALLDLDEMQKDALGLSSSLVSSVKKNIPYPLESDSGIAKKGLKQLHEMFGVTEIVPHNSSFDLGTARKGTSLEPEEREQILGDGHTELPFHSPNLKTKDHFESEHADKAEGEVQKLQKDLSDMQAEKEEVLIQYQQCLDKLLNLEEEFSHAQNDCMRFSNDAIKAATEVLQLKEALVKLEYERDAGLIKHEECLKRISNLEAEVSRAQEDAEELDGRATKAKFEAQCLKNELSRLECEKEIDILEYKKSLEKISKLEGELSVAENNARLLNGRTDRAEVEVRRLEKAVVELNEDKEAAALLYRNCLGKISKLESEVSCAREDVKRLNSEVLMGASKLTVAEEKCAVLEISNQSLQLEAENLAEKIAMKDQLLSEKHEELEKLQICIEDERSHHVQIENALNTLPNKHSQSQEEQKSIALEYRNGLQMLKDLEICKHNLEEEIQRIEDENRSLKDLNSSSNNCMKNLQNEILGLREMKEKLEVEVAFQIGQSDSLLQDIFHLKEEIKGMNQRYQALLEQLGSVGLNPECIRSSVKDLQDENSKLWQLCVNDRDEKAALSKKLENIEKLSEKSVALEISLSEVNCQLTASNEKVRELQESCQLLYGEKFSLVSEKVTLLSQLQICTDNMEKLLEKHGALENSLSGANAELAALREKSKGLEEIWKFLKNENSNLLAERRSMVVQLQNDELRLENLEKQFTGLEGKYMDLEKEKVSMQSLVESLRTSLYLEKKERTSSTVLNETRLASLENHVHFLQEENRWRKTEFEAERDKAVNSQFEIFILQKFIQDMEEKNYLLLIECQKHVEASKWTEALISELENENLEQQVETEILLDKIQKLRLGICQVFRALEIGPDCGFGDKIENDQIYVNNILGNVEVMMSSQSKYEDEKQQLLVENSVLLALLGQLKLDGIETQSEKKTLVQELKIMVEQLVKMQNDKQEILEMNRQLKSEVTEAKLHANEYEAEVETLYTKQEDLQRSFLELEKEYARVIEENRSFLKQFAKLKEEKCLVEEENGDILLEMLTLGYLSMIFKSFGAEKAEEVELLSENLCNLHGRKDNLENEVSILRRELGMTETGNLLLKDSVERLEMELYVIRECNGQLAQEISSGMDILIQRETELLDTEEKLKAKEKLNSELCKTVERLKKEFKESNDVKEDFEEHIIKLSEQNASQSKEIECLRIQNGSLISEVDLLREEIEKLRIKEENLCSELQEKNNEFELWDAEASTFYFDLQISSIREVLLKNKVEELTEVCKTLKGENTSKALEIDQMKERFSFMESETEGLKSQLYAYIPAIASLRENVASLEHNTLSRTKVSVIETREPKDVEAEDWQYPPFCQELIEDHISLVPNGISDLNELQRRIRSVEKMVVEGMDKNKMLRSLKTNMQVEDARRETEDLKYKCRSGAQKGKHKGTWGRGNELDDIEFPGISMSFFNELPRIKSVEKVVVEETDKSKMLKSLKTNVQVEAAMRETEEFKSKCRLGAQKGKHKETWGLENNLDDNLHSRKTDSNSGTLMKDIPLDQVSDGNFYAIRRGRRVASHGVDDQMLELWETAEQDCSMDQIMKNWQMKAYDPKEEEEDNIAYRQSEDLEKKSEDLSSESNVEKELCVDRLEVPTNIRRRGNSAKILERLASDGQKLAGLQTTLHDLKKKLEANKKIKKAKDVDLGTVKEQLNEVEETVFELTDLNGRLVKSIMTARSFTDRNSSESEKTRRARRRNVSEQARRGSEKIGRLQLEIQKIQYLLLKYEDEKKSRVRNRFSKSRTTVILRDYFIHSGRRSYSGRRKVRSQCGCFRPPNNNEDSNSS